MDCEEKGMSKAQRLVLFALAALLAVTAPLAKSQEEDKKPLLSSAESPKPPEKTIGADDPSIRRYTIGEQDLLDIVVWREKELSVPVVVRPDGKITIPLVGEIYVIGMTPLQLRGTLADK